VTTRVPEFEVLEGDTPFLVRWKNPPDFSEDELLELIYNNDELEIERECDGSLLMSSGVTLPTNRQEGEVYFRLRVWAEKDGRGEALGPTGRYHLPNRSMRGPDAAWIRHEPLDALTDRELRYVPHLVPEFVVEVRSKSNRLRRLQAKMEEYVANGVRLGWLLDPMTRTAYVYRPGAEVQVVEGASSLDGSPELPGFVLDLAKIFS
jgi:Uma2 family endonuclease